MPLGAFKAALMGTAGVSTGDVVLLHDTDYSSVSEAAITSGITSTYGEYIFKFYNIHPENDDVNFGFQVNATDSTSYDEYITSSTFRTYNFESGGTPVLTYFTSTDQAQGQARQMLSFSLDATLAHSNMAGEFHLFNPASTYVKHFIAQTNDKTNNVRSESLFTGGYINTTTAIDDIKFTMSAGDFNGTIKMWGVK